MLKIGLSTCSHPITEEFFKQYADAGISCMEVSVEIDKAEDLDWPSIFAWSQKYGVELWSFHLPFYKNNLSSPDEEKRLKSVENYTDFIIKIADFGVKVFVAHPSQEPIPEEERDVYMAQSKKSLKTLAEVADKCMVTIAVEDLPRTCLGRNSSDMLDLISADDRLRICFDTNHLLSENIKEFIEKVGDKIVTTHISDYDFINERHWLPGEGDIDWQELYTTLIKVGYNGPWMYELGFKAPKSIKRDRDLTALDFAENAKAIFENKTPKNISTRYEKLDSRGNPVTE